MDTTKSTASTGPENNPAPKSDAKVERVIYCIVLFVIAIVPLLAFVFSFGNVGNLGTSLGIDYRIAYLTGPSVDLSVVGLIVAATWLSYRGWNEKRLWPVHLLSVACGLIMFALNCGQAIYEGHTGRAAFDAVGPFLLAAWGFVGPWLLRQLAEARQRHPAEPGIHEGTGTGAVTAPAPAGIGTAPALAAAPTAPAPAPSSAPKAAPAPNPMPRPGIAAAANGTGPKPAAATNGTGSGSRRSPEEWAELAEPLWRRYVDKHGEPPTAPVLAGLLRNAHPDLRTGESERWERNVRAALVERLSKAENTSDDDSEPAAAVIS